MKNFCITVFTLVLLTGCNSNSMDTTSILLINHLGYTENGPKKVILQTKSEKAPSTFWLVSEEGKKVFEGKFQVGGKVDNWHTGNAFAADFSVFVKSGKYYIETSYVGSKVKSPVFKIKNDIFTDVTLPLLLKGLKSIHPAEKYEKWDSNISFHGDREDKVDVHGGWYDASGDFSKYLSHLCYTNFMAPQQTPMVVYNLLETSEYLNKTDSYKDLAKEYVAESAWGADFLVRMQDAEGYFYTIVFDTWSKDPTRREICAYETQAGTRTTDYKAAFREGAGISIAALAKLSRLGVSGEYSSDVYLEKAEKGFAHLLENNTNYCDNGEENIIDDYCALMAAVELYAATDKDSYLEHAQMRASNLRNRMQSDNQYKGWFSANTDGSRPYFHAAEAGYPIISLCKYLEVEKEQALRNKTIETIQNAVDFELTITNEVHNPFGYPRQYVKAINEDQPRAAFFVPHKNESGYWYQGENARIASLATAFNISKAYMLPKQQAQVKTFTQNQINWVLGLNPYNICMLDGVGYNNPEYLEPHDWNYVGGIANGITAGVEDETDIAFLPHPQGEDSAERWRWPEQWIPHAGWFMLAVVTAQE